MTASNFTEVPHAGIWPVQRARFLFRERRQRSWRDDAQLTASQSYGVISQKTYQETTGNRVTAALAGTENFLHVEPDDFVISLRTFEGGIEHAKERGCISPAYTVMQPAASVQASFYRYLLKCDAFVQALQTAVTGIRDGKSVRYEQFANLLLPFPDLKFQKAIADFLDRETARIDLLIEKKQRLVEVVEERKTAQLERLLFGSGFELRKLRRETSIISKGTTPSTIGAEMVTEGIRFLKAENITWNGVNTSPENYISEETHRLLKRSALASNDVLVVIAGATTGKTTVMPSALAPANTNQAVSFLRLRQQRFAPVVCAAIACPCVQRDILLTSVQSAQPNLSMEDLGNLMLPFPPDHAIEDTLRKVSVIRNNADGLVAAVQKSVDRLKEYRAALITAAVTGRINVATYGRGTTDRTLDRIEAEMGA